MLPDQIPGIPDHRNARIARRKLEKEGGWPPDFRDPILLNYDNPRDFYVTSSDDPFKYGPPQPHFWNDIALFLMKAYGVFHVVAVTVLMAIALYAVWEFPL